MERWCGKVAVVTGASSGIGAAIVIDLAKAGMTVIGLARRKERLDELSAGLPKSVKGKLFGYKCDISKEDEVKKAFAWIKSEFGGVDVLVNNAGIINSGIKLVDLGTFSQLKNVMDVNVMGLILCTQEAVQSMKERNAMDGHIILINSIGGHKVPTIPNTSLAIYPATKFALTAITEIMRHEFNMLQSKIKVTSVSPGAVETEIFTHDDALKDVVKEMPMLKSEDVSAAVLYSLGTPPHVQVHEITIKPIGEAF